MKLLEERFHKQVLVFNKLLRQQKRNISIEGVHDLRVCTRRLQSLIWLLEKSQSLPARSRIKDYIKDLGQTLGDKRQWDVALKGARKYHLLQKDLKREQGQAGVQLQKTLRNKNTFALALALTQLDREFSGQAFEIPRQSLRKIESELKRWLSAKKLSRDQLHKLRIFTKKVRYVFEALDIPMQDLKDLQDHLGKSHDLTVLNNYFKGTKPVKKDEKRERKKVKMLIRPALRSSLEVLKALR